MSAAFVTLLSTVVPQRLFSMLIYSFSILDMDWGSMGVERVWGIGLEIQDTIDKTVVEHSQQIGRIVLHLKTKQVFIFNLEGGCLTNAHSSQE